MILAAILLILWPAALLMLVCLCQIAGRADANLASGPAAGVSGFSERTFGQCEDRPTRPLRSQLHVPPDAIRHLVESADSIIDAWKPQP